jgi:lipoyl(octanoyl) transferase
MRWRLIIDPDLCGPENMAVDEAISRVMDSNNGVTAPTFRLYGWKEPTISIGYMQEEDRFTRSGLPVVRRITGGRAVLHDMEVTYSVVTGSGNPLFALGIDGAYSLISGCIVNALKDVGIEAGFSRGVKGSKGAGRDACFYTPSKHEVIIDGRKLVGSSQRRFKNAFIQHGSIIFNIDRELNSSVFGRGVIERMAWIEALRPVDKETFRAALVRRFAEGLDAIFEKGGLSGAEEKVKREVLEGKYLSRVPWNADRGAEAFA